MPDIQVTTNPQALLGGPENMKTELKRSIFFAPGEHLPGTKQYYNIAKTIAGFINGEGGTLWLGCDDCGNVVGIENDLAALGCGSAQPCRGPHSNDMGMTFGGTADKYILKLKELVKAILEPGAEKYIANTEAKVVHGKIIVKVPVAKADPGFIAYVNKWNGSKGEYTELLYQRVANGTSELYGRGRDEFIRGKCREEFQKQLEALQTNAIGLTKDELVSELQKLKEQHTIFPQVQVEGAVPITDPNFPALKKPVGFVFDGLHVCDAKGWKAVYRALLVKLDELDAAKFDGIESDAFFKKYFVLVVPKKKYADYYTDRLGTAKNIRAKEMSGQDLFANPDRLVHKLLARFGVEPSRVALRG